LLVERKEKGERKDEPVETLLDFPRNLNERLSLDHDVHTRDNLRLGETPDVKVVDVENAGNRRNGRTEAVEGNGGGNALKKDERGGLDEREGGGEDDDGDDKGDGRVGIHLPGEVGEPDEETGRDDSDVSEL
jgi:hypothetical protein